jgi:cytochrome c biogenesis protein CcmG/thiol:disulfide interchange protein DsbE
MMRAMRWVLPALALAAAACAGGRPALARSWIVGRPIDLSATTLAGEPVALGGADGRVRVVVLWATWCGRCPQLLPALDVLAGGDEGRGLAIHAVAVDADVAKLREALPRIPPRIHVLWDRGAERLGERLGIEELPTILVIDRRGVVRHVHEGADEGIVGLVDREVRRLLQE